MCSRGLSEKEFLEDVDGNFYVSSIIKNKIVKKNKEMLGKKYSQTEKYMEEELRFIKNNIGPYYERPLEIETETEPNKNENKGMDKFVKNHIEKVKNKILKKRNQNVYMGHV